MSTGRVIAIDPDEAKSLYFEAPAKPRKRGYPIRAKIILASGEHRFLHAAILDPTERRARWLFIRRLTKTCPAIDPLYAEDRLTEFAESRKVECIDADLAISFPNIEPEKPVTPQNEETVNSPASPAEAMLRDPDLLGLIVKKVQALGVAGEEDLISLVYLSATSRLLRNPFSLIVSSGTGTGKSHTVNQTLRCIPVGEKVVLTKLTPAALYRLCDSDPNALRHKVLVLGEMRKQKGDAVADATADLRQLISDGEVARIVADSNDVSSQRLQVVKGPIAFIQTTTNRRDEIFAENLNRCLLVKTDDSPAQNRRVLELTAARKAGKVSVDEDAIIELLHDLPRKLQPHQVVIPYAEELGRIFPDNMNEVRRAFYQFCSVIEASALLHQMQRDLDPQGRLVATLDDYDIAWRLCSGPLEEVLGRRISTSAIEFFGRLLEWPKLRAADGSLKSNAEFTTTEAWKYVSKSDSIVLKWLKELASIGAVENIAPGKGQRAKLWRLTGMTFEEVESRGISLPQVNELAILLGLATTEVQVGPSM